MGVGRTLESSVPATWTVRARAVLDTPLPLSLSLSLWLRLLFLFFSLFTQSFLSHSLPPPIPLFLFLSRSRSRSLSLLLDLTFLLPLEEHVSHTSFNWCLICPSTVLQPAPTLPRHCSFFFFKNLSYFQALPSLLITGCQRSLIFFLNVFLS